MNISILTDTTDKKCIRKIISFPDLDDSAHILLAVEKTPLERGNIYVTTEAHIDALCQRVRPEDRITFYVAGSSCVQDDVVKEHGINLICVDMDHAELHNKLLTIRLGLNELKTGCMMDIMESSMPFKLVSRAAEVLSTPIFLLNKRFEVLYQEANSTSNNRMYTTLRETYHMNPEDLVGFDPDLIKVSGLVFDTVDGGCCWIRAITKSDGDTLYYLAAPLRGAHTGASFDAVLEIVCSYIVIQARRSPSFNTGAEQTLAGLLDAMSENRDMTPEELRVRLKCLEHPVKRYFKTVIFFPDDNGNRDSLLSILGKVRDLYPGQNVSIYRGTIVMVYSIDSMHLNIPEEEKLNKLLADSCFCAVINNPISNWTNLYTNYTLSLSIMNLALTMKNNVNQSNTRIFTFENYSTYLMINLCQQAFFKMGLKDDSLIYLGTPSLTSLIIYDNMNDDNLVEVLYHYLLNEKNAIKTGEAIYMHRNTVRKKLAKIKEIMEIDIDDPAMHFRLLFSCILLQYYRDYLRRPFLATPQSSLGMDSLWPTYPIKL